MVNENLTTKYGHICRGDEKRPGFSNIYRVISSKRGAFQIILQANFWAKYDLKEKKY